MVLTSRDQQSINPLPSLPYPSLTRSAIPEGHDELSENRSDCLPPLDRKRDARFLIDFDLHPIFAFRTLEKNVFVCLCNYTYMCPNKKERNNKVLVSIEIIELWFILFLIT